MWCPSKMSRQFHSKADVRDVIQQHPCTVRVGRAQFPLLSRRMQLWIDDRFVIAETRPGGRLMRVQGKQSSCATVALWKGDVDVDVGCQMQRTRPVSFVVSTSVAVFLTSTPLVELFAAMQPRAIPCQRCRKRLL